MRSDLSYMEIDRFLKIRTKNVPILHRRQQLWIKKYIFPSSFELPSWNTIHKFGGQIITHIELIHFCHDTRIY